MLYAVVPLVAGIVLMVVAGALHRQDQSRAIGELLGLTPVSREKHADEELSGFADRAVVLAGQAVDRVDADRAFVRTLDRARIPLAPGEFLVVIACGALGVAALLTLLAHSALMGAAGALVAVLVVAHLVKRRVKKRRRAFEAQLPDALSLVASSLSAGHTFLRAVQMMCQESGPPMSEEFARVVAETSLGDPVVDALGRMAGRLEIRDLDMVVQAIRIQQSVGGRLADLLHTLSDVIRARDEVRREVLVLTAEGRLSAYVLAGLVPFLFLVIRVTNPTYIQPLYHGWGLGLLVGCFASVLVGMLVILRMVKIEV